MPQVQIIEPTIRPQKQKIRVCAYARVSSNSDDQLNSFSAQVEYFTQLIQAHSDWEFIDIYADEGITGTRADKRDDFQRMMRDCRAGRIDRILVKSISRFGRNSADCIEAVRELKMLGIAVAFEKEGIDKKKKKNNGELTQYYITDNHPAIISREDFLNVQLELTRRNSKKKVSQKKTKSALGKYCSKYALSERLVCGECGSMYRRTTWVKKGKKKVVWRCISRLEFGTKYCQHSPTISEEALHQAILQCIQKVVEDKEDILKNLRDVQENIILFSGNQITPQSLEKQIDKLQQEMSALVKIIAQGGDSEFYAAKLRQLSEQKMGLTSQLQEIQKKKMADQAQEYQYQQALLYINNEENLNLTEFNDDFIRRIIEQITVLSATQIRIRFVGGYEQDANLPLKK